VWQKANEIKGFLKKFSAKLLSKLVAETEGKAFISATRKPMQRVNYEPATSTPAN
jgi:hypothetical protein